MMTMIMIGWLVGSLINFVILFLMMIKMKRELVTSLNWWCLFRICSACSVLLFQKSEYNKHFQTLSLRGWERLKTDLQKWHYKISVYRISCFISVCPFVAASKAKFAQNVLVLSNHYLLNSIHFNLLCVLIYNKHVRSFSQALWWCQMFPVIQQKIISLI